MKLQILVLHNLSGFDATLRSMVDYIKCFERYGPPGEYLYHRITDPVTEALRDMRFHVVIFDASALGICRFRPRELWEEHKANLAFLADSDAVKLGFPQDDYHQSNTLDTLFADFRFDVIYSVIPERPERLYPRSCARGIRVETVLTGYVDDESVHNFESYVRPFDSRSIDVGQRVTMYSPLGGRHARKKGQLAVAVAEEARRRGLRVDVSTDDRQRIVGDAWFRFLGDTRYVTGCEGGVSIWDPEGLIFDRVESYLQAHPGAPFGDVEAACFPGEDGQHVFSAVSPRLFEAAMMRCCQIQIEAPYLGVLKAFDHYIPVRADLSDVPEALELARDHEAAVRRVHRTYEALIDTPAFRYSTLAKRVFAGVEGLISARHIQGLPPGRFKALARRHARGLRQIARRDRTLQLIRTARARIVPAGLKPYIRRLLSR